MTLDDACGAWKARRAGFVVTAALCALVFGCSNTHQASVDPQEDAGGVADAADVGVGDGGAGGDDARVEDAPSDTASAQDAGDVADAGAADAAPDAQRDAAPDSADAPSDADAADHTDTPRDVPEHDAAQEDARSDDAGDASEPDVPDTPPPGPALYVGDAYHSPLTAYHVERLRSVVDQGGGRADVFAKVGASSTVNPHAFVCLGTDAVELDGRDALEPARAFFAAGDAAGDSPYARETIAAEVGRSTGWATSGDPSPLDQELDAIAPQLAFIHYGTNDMQLGSTYASAMYRFADDLLELADITLARGVVPVLLSIFPRADRAEADLWVPTYNQIVRAVAQARQVPFVDIHAAVVDLPGGGLSGDGIHPNVYRSGGSARPCDFTEGGLTYGFNMRNLVTLEALDRLHTAMVLGVPEDQAAPELEGSGGPDDPFVIPEVPFAHHADTRTSPHAALDTYTGCEASQNEGGPELIYRLTLDAPTALRIVVFDQGSTDIDVHLLGASATEEACAARAHQLLQGVVPAGTWHLALDSFVSSNGTVRDGAYTLIVLPCTEGDPACAEPLVP